MRIEASVTSISWIPSEAVEGLPKLPFTFGVAHYDDPPPDRVDHLETMHRADLFREANELRGWIEVDDGKIVDYGHAGRGRIGLTRLRLGPKELAVPAVAMPTLQDTEVGDGWVRFTQTAGGRTGVPAPRSVRGKPYVQLNSAIAWTTLAVTIHANEKIEHELVGAVGPGAIVGERAGLEDGMRTASLRAKTPAKVIGVRAEELSREALEQVAAARSSE